jgi:hypothetical protein
MFLGAHNRLLGRNASETRVDQSRDGRFPHRGSVVNVKFYSVKFCSVNVANVAKNVATCCNRC